VVGLVAGSHVVNHAYLVVLAPLVGALSTEFGVGVAEVGVAIGLQSAVVALLQLPFGYLSDTRSRSLVLGISLSVGAVGVALTAVAPTYELLLAAQVVLGVGVAGHHPAHYPLLAAAVSDGQRGRAYSIHALGGAVGFALSPAVVAGVVGLGYDWRVAVGVIAAVGTLAALVAAVAVRRVAREVTHPPRDDRETASVPALADRSLADLRTVPRRVARGVATLLSAPGILGLTSLAFVTSAAAWGVRAYTPTLLTSAYALGDGAANVVVSAMFLTGGVFILLGGALTDRLGAGRILLGGYVALVVVAAVLAAGLVPSVGPVLAAGGAAVPLALALVVLPLDGTISVSRPARSTLADRLSRRSDLGKNFALVTVGISGGGAVAPPVFGWLIDASGVRVAFGVVAVVGLLALVQAVFVVRRAATTEG
jgi:MFS family permease